MTSKQKTKTTAPNVTKNAAHFTDNRGSRGTYKLDIEFFKRIAFENSTWEKTMWNLKFVIAKESTGPYWPRLLKQTVKMQNIKVDWYVCARPLFLTILIRSIRLSVVVVVVVVVA